MWENLKSKTFYRRGGGRYTSTGGHGVVGAWGVVVLLEVLSNMKTLNKKSEFRQGRTAEQPELDKRGSGKNSIPYQNFRNETLNIDHTLTMNV